MGGQAELLRVPHAGFNLLDLPPGREHENDFTAHPRKLFVKAGDKVKAGQVLGMLSDIFPTGWHGTALAGMHPDDRVAVFGAGR